MSDRRPRIFSLIFLPAMLMLFRCGGGGSDGDADAVEETPADPAAEDAAGDEAEARPDQETAPETAEEILEVAETADPAAEDADIADVAEDDAPGEATGPCDDRTGGALVTLSVCAGTETMTEWIENDAFIDEAIAILGGQAPRVPNMPLADGTDCDPQWSWHVDPLAVQWADMTIELCDGCPSFVEADLSYWLGTVHSFCPWNADVAAVDDRR